MSANYWLEAARNSLWMDCLAIAKESHSPFGEAGHKLIAAGYYKQVCGGDGGPLDDWSQPNSAKEVQS